MRQAGRSRFRKTTCTSLSFQGLYSVPTSVGVEFTFAIRVARVAKLLQDADQTGMDWSPIAGPATEAVPL